MTVKDFSERFRLILGNLTLAFGVVTAGATSLAGVAIMASTTVEKIVATWKQPPAGPGVARLELQPCPCVKPLPNRGVRLGDSIPPE